MKKQTRREEEDFDQYFDFEDSYDEHEEDVGISKNKDARKFRYDMTRKFKNKRFEDDEY